MVARLLRLVGLYLGPDDRLEGPNPSNPLGHYEHQGVMAVNNAVLAHFGGSWDNPPTLKGGWEQHHGLEPLVKEAQAVIDEFSSHELWGWKDPRTTLVLPFWMRLVPNLRFVICVRGPLEVARSLAARDHMMIEHGVYLWHHYMRDAIKHTAGQSRLLTFYEDYFRNPEWEVARLVDFCGLATPPHDSPAWSAIVQELQHHRTDATDLIGETAVAVESKLLYLSMRALTLPSVSTAIDGMPRDRDSTDQISRLIDLIDILRDERLVVGLRNELIQKDIQIGKYRGMIEEKDREFRTQQNDLAWLQEHVKTLNRELEWIQSTLSWRLIIKFGVLIDRVFPHGTRRHVIYRKMLDAFKSLLMGGR
jgi:hypothetical protein